MIAPVVLSAPERVLELTAGKIITVTAITAQESCFAGHYPDFPILPGVLLIELTHRAVRRYAAVRVGSSVRLHTLHTVRFFDPVGPGDEVTTECDLSTEAGLIEVVARCRTSRGRACTVRAQYALRPTQA